MNYIPKPLQNKTYYHPSDIGVERQSKENLRKLKRWENSSFQYFKIDT